MGAESHNIGHGLPDPLGGLLDFPVSEMSISERHADIGMTEQSGHHRHRHAVHHRVARMRVPQVVKPHILNPGLLSDAGPEPEFSTARPGRIAWRGKHERAPVPGLPVENLSRPGVERHLPRPRLGVGENQEFVVDLGPSQADDLALAAPGQPAAEPDDVGLRPLAPGGRGRRAPGAGGAISSRDRKRVSGGRRFRLMPREGLVSIWPRATAKFMIWRNSFSALLALPGAVRLTLSNQRLTWAGVMRSSRFDPNVGNILTASREPKPLLVDGL